MGILIYLLTTLFVVTCLFLVFIILLQPGKGASMGAALGAATSQQVFGGRGATSFLEKLTVGAAVVFMVLTLSLSFLKNRENGSIKLREKAEKAAKKAKADREANEKLEKARKDLEKQPTLSDPAPNSSSSQPSTSAVPSVPAAPAPAPSNKNLPQPAETAPTMAPTPKPQ